MKKNALILAMILAPIVSGCMPGNVKAPPPAADSAAAILIRIPNTCLPLTPCAQKTLTFARLRDDGIFSGELYRTTVVRDDHYYLLNARPGRYVAVAASYSRGLQTGGNVGAVAVTMSRVFGEHILFAEELVRQTLVEVAPGELAVMGEYDFGIEGRMALAPSAAGFMKEADPVQLHYARLLDPEMESRGVTSEIKFYRARLESGDRGADSRRKLLDTAVKHIGAEGWNGHIARSGE